MLLALYLALSPLPKVLAAPTRPSACLTIARLSGGPDVPLFCSSDRQGMIFNHQAIHVANSLTPSTFRKLEGGSRRSSAHPRWAATPAVRRPHRGGEQAELFVKGDEGCVGSSR